MAKSSKNSDTETCTTENCLRCTHPEIYKDYAHLDEGTAKDRRCCRNCVHFNDQDSTCPEGGYSEIGNADRRFPKKSATDSERNSW